MEGGGTVSHERGVCLRGEVENAFADNSPPGALHWVPGQREVHAKVQQRDPTAYRSDFAGIRKL